MADCVLDKPGLRRLIQRERDRALLLPATPHLKESPLCRWLLGMDDLFPPPSCLAKHLSKSRIHSIIRCILSLHVPISRGMVRVSGMRLGSLRVRPVPPIGGSAGYQLMGGGSVLPRPRSGLKDAFPRYWEGVGRWTYLSCQPSQGIVLDWRASLPKGSPHSWGS